MRIRLAAPADIPAMMQLEALCSSAAHWSREQYDRIFEAEGPRRAAWVVEAEGTTPSLYGFLVAQEVAGEWEIENIVVQEQMRRQRLATRLVVELQEAAHTERASAIFLEVRASNRGARAFYEGCGFLPNGRRPRYYSQPDEDAITYRLTLA